MEHRISIWAELCQWGGRKSNSFQIVIAKPLSDAVQVKGKNFGTRQLAWHWSIVIVSAALTLGTTAAGINYIISDSIRYHVFADI